jgi:DNA (cytosine-5)-methyltransferase 1
MVLGDVSEVSSDSIPAADLIIGGFPCQGFSQANLLRRGSDDRNKLYLQFVRLVQDKQPRYFVAENVRGILSLEAGAAFARILSDFRSIGYRVEHRVLNAADFGVPQTRVRVFLIGVRADLPFDAHPTFPEPTHSRFPTGNLKAWVSIGEALSGLPDPDGGEVLPPNHIYSKYRVVDRNFTGHRPTDPSKPSPTILARGNGGGGVCAIPHPSGMRRLTVRESARVQTFPDEFVFAGAMNSMYRQVGNAVPVLLARRIAESLPDARIASSMVAA